MTAIIAQDVHRSYGRVRALDGLTLDVRAGEIFGLLGANGAGKTTLIKTLIGAVRPQRGSVRVLGSDPARHPALVRRQTGYMPQFPALYDDLSPRENVTFFGRPHGIPNLRQRVDEVLAFVQLTARADDPVHGFSGGMKQRTSLACALVHQPPLLLLDEPTTGIDPRLREAFWTHFRAQTSDGATLVISTHQMDEALHCDRIAVMRDGRVLACDTPRGLLARGRVRVEVQRAGEKFQETLPNQSDALPGLLRRFGLDAAVTHIDVREDTLEDVVLGLMNDRSGENGA